MWLDGSARFYYLGFGCALAIEHYPLSLSVVLSSETVDTGRFLLSQWTSIMSAADRCRGSEAAKYDQVENEPKIVVEQGIRDAIPLVK
jgi:hypothetical protein